MFQVNISFDATTRVLADESGSDDYTIATMGDNDTTKLVFNITDSENLLEGYAGRVEFDVWVKSSDNVVYKPYILLDENNSAVIPNYILANAKRSVLPIQLAFGDDNGNELYSFNKLQYTVRNSVNATGTQEEAVPEVMQAYVSIAYDSDTFTLTFTRLNGSTTEIQLSELFGPMLVDISSSIDDESSENPIVLTLYRNDGNTEDVGLPVPYLSDGKIPGKFFDHTMVVDLYKIQSVSNLTDGTCATAQPPDFALVNNAILYMCIGNDPSQSSSWYQVNYPLISEWQSTPDNVHIPSEKLVKDSLDAEATARSNADTSLDNAKLDKVTTSNAYVRLYGVTALGGQAMYNLDAGKNGGTVAWRDAQGHLVAEDPSVAGHVATKNYVDTGLLGKAPTNHASSETTYGVGSSSQYGHVKVDNAMSDTSTNPVQNCVIRDFVNSSIATSTANFLGTYDAIMDLGFTQAQVDAWGNEPTAQQEADISTAIGNLTLPSSPTNNDYLFISVNRSTTIDVDSYWKFKYTVATTPASWMFEYPLNNSSFTQAQWDTLNSLLTNSGSVGIDVQDIIAHIGDSKIHVPAETTAGKVLTSNSNGQASWADSAPYATGIGSASTNIGSDTKPIKVVNGVPTAVTNDLVDTATNQNIGGTKTFTTHVYVAGGHDNSAFISKNSRLNNNATSEDELFVGAVNTSGNLIAGLAVRQTTTGGKLLEVKLRNSAGTSYSNFNLIDNEGHVRSTTAPLTQNDTMVATTAWVKDTTVDNSTNLSKNGLVHNTGNENIDGAKTFANTPTITSHALVLKNGTYAKDLSTTTYTNLADIVINDKNNAILSQIRTDHLQDDSRRVFLLLERTINSTNYQNRLSLVINSSGDSYVTLPHRSYSSAGNDDVLVKAHVADMMSANVGNGQISLTSSRGTAIDNFTVNQSSGKNIVLPASSTQYTNQSLTFALQSTPDFTDYPYMASKSITGLTSDMYASVTYDDSQVSSGQYAPFCQTLAGEVRLYAKSDVGTQTIPTISVGMDDSSAQQSMSNFVTLNGAQDILGEKNYVSNTLRVKDRSEPVYSTNPSSNRQAIMQQMTGTDETWAYRDEFWKYANGDAILQHRLRTPNAENEFRQGVSGSSAYAILIGQRVYSASNTRDVVTIGSLQSSTDVVHTSGNETISGIKTFSNITVLQTRPLLYVRVPTGSTNYWAKVATFTPTRQVAIIDVTQAHQSLNGGGAGRLLIKATDNPTIQWLYKKISGTTLETGSFAICSTSDKRDIWMKANAYYIYLDVVRLFRGNVDSDFSKFTLLAESDITFVSAIPTSDYTSVVYSTE